MQRYGAITLQVQRLRPVRRENLWTDQLDPITKKRTYDKIDILRICDPLKLDCQIVQVPDLHHGFIRPRPNSKVPILRTFYLYRRFGERKILYEL